MTRSSETRSTSKASFRDHDSIFSGSGSRFVSETEGEDKRDPLFLLEELLHFGELLERFSRAGNIPLALCAPSGASVVEPVTLPTFCARVRETPSGKLLCAENFARIGGELFASRRTRLSRCSCGLVLVGHPLFLQENPLGFLLSGHVLFRRYRRDELLGFCRRRWSFSETPEAFLEVFLKTPVVDERLIGGMRECLDLVGGQILDMAGQYSGPGVSMLGQARMTPAGGAAEELSREVRREIVSLRSAAINSQLNPHFLFNTLNTIYRFAQAEEARKTQELTLHLAEYLRYVLRAQAREELVPLKLELACARRYLAIYATRFEEKISFRIESEPETEQILIPFMLVQPLVENAIRHGLEPSRNPGCISLRASLVAKRLLLVIEDDGVGCDLREIREGIGLTGVRARLRLHYGEKGLLEFLSAPGKGTKVSLHVPF